METSHMDLETSLDRMCMGLQEINFRLARIEVAVRKQNLRVQLNKLDIGEKKAQSMRAESGQQERICP
jgi:hypothetical protein